eukprot:TRINITY_DN2655_c2_g1_i1.p2 TRINITY_DN2655_c2_g1~~TRINITY_DN2655_c2_g1_i1.p2  ORF type:complete len:112 (+),score=17.75 TRINITY_DN2655_c2_g1_i1:338-673(+)
MKQGYKMKIAFVSQDYLWGMESDGFQIEHELSQQEVDEFNLEYLGQQIMKKLINDQQNQTQVMCFCVPGVAVQLPWTHGLREYVDRGDEGGAHLIAVLAPEVLKECMDKFK